MEGLKQGDRVTYEGREVKRGEFMYYAKSKGYLRRAVVFFNGNQKPSNVNADQLQRENK